MRGKNKVALAVELIICFRAEPDDQYIHLNISQFYLTKVEFQDSNLNFDKTYSQIE